MVYVRGAGLRDFQACDARVLASLLPPSHRRREQKRPDALITQPERISTGAAPDSQYLPR